MRAIATTRSVPAIDCDPQEWELRCDMAAVFRVLARNNWNEQIGNHNSLMLPGTEHYLINPRGLLFREIRASDLIVCDFDGNVVRGTGELRRIAFNIHAEIHKWHPQAACVLHVHPPYLTAFSLLDRARLGLAHQNNLFLNERVAYDDRQHGILFGAQEGQRIAEALGDKSILIMAGHGVTVVGTRICDAFDELYFAERTCMYQMLALQTGLPLMQQADEHKIPFIGPFGDHMDSRFHLDAWRRILDREEPDYAS
ncbi:class II aldolase/adducin family protein [Microvirga sp. BT689]|uniref:class II aldolase/adducin family protein n=1 Tax=Microvirga arvi TaxID=2778731 RepID=UPI00194FBD48|nr:class II aldolase/adducin family protein [Microvirga arvi]MBM6583176.1 class II aldolase/adducin family protein [Microvirga arvi]